MRFYKLSQDTAKFEELKSLILSIFVHDPKSIDLFINNSFFFRSLHVYESETETLHENHFFQTPSSLCILLKGKAEIYFRELLLGDLSVVGQPKIITLYDYMYNRPFKVVCEPRTEILFMSLSGVDIGKEDNNDEHHHIQYTKFIQQEFHKTVGLHFKSPADNISLKLDALEHQLEKQRPDCSQIPEITGYISAMRTQLEILNNHIKKSVVKSDVVQGADSLKLLRVNPEDIIRDFFKEMRWDAELTIGYTDEDVKIFLDVPKFKIALSEIISFFLQNKPEQYPHQWILNYNRNREQLEIIFYVSFDKNRPPDFFENDREVTAVSVQDNLPLLSDIINSHKGNIQIYEKNSTIKIRIHIPQNLWRIQIKSPHFFIVDKDRTGIERLTRYINEKFERPDVIPFENISSAIEGFYQHRPEAIFFCPDHDYEGINGIEVLKKLLTAFLSPNTDECIFVPMTQKYTWEELEKIMPDLGFGYIPKPLEDIGMQRAVNTLYTFINRYRILRHSYKDVKMSAERDGLTGLYNRWYLDQYCSTLIEHSKDANNTFSMIITDIDNFKVYNDTNGHQLGDKALQKFARVVSGCVRLTDTVARYGGEEFVVMLPRTTSENALKIGEKIRLAVEKEAFENEIAQPLKKVTASFGVANYPADGNDIKSVLKKADENLYVAKQQGRNRVVG